MTPLYLIIDNASGISIFLNIIDNNFQHSQYIIIEA